ncbi:MAG: ASCH domain-containing protein [Micropepsaceae bacterium]
MSAAAEKYAGVLRFSFGDNPALADELLALVLEGKKTATCGDWAETEQTYGIMKPGDLAVVKDGAGREACVIETIEVTKRRFCDVDATFAFEEGEDDRTLDSWRREHRRYFERNGGWSEDMWLACERFRLVEVLP